MLYYYFIILTYLWGAQQYTTMNSTATHFYPCNLKLGSHVKKKPKYLVLDVQSTPRFLWNAKHGK